MSVLFSECFTKSFKEAPEKIQKDFGKQLAHLFYNWERYTLYKSMVRGIVCQIHCDIVPDLMKEVAYEKISSKRDNFYIGNFIM